VPWTGFSTSSTQGDREPVVAQPRFLPGEPGLAGLLGREVDLGESLFLGEFQGVVADDQDVTRLLHHGPGDGRRMQDIAQGGHASAAVGRPVHDGGVELDDPVLVGRAPEADAVIVRVGLDDGHARDRRVEGVGPLLDQLHGNLDRLEIAAGDDDRTLRPRRLRLRRADGQRAEA
jgi:hypothetical protein